MKLLFSILISLVFIQSVFSTVTILEVIPIEKVIDTNETQRVNLLILENQSIWNNFLNYFTSNEIVNLFYNKTQIDEKLENVSIEEETQSLINLTISDIGDDTTNINLNYENSTELLSIENLNETHTQLSNFKEMCIYEENNQTIIKMELC